MRAGIGMSRALEQLNRRSAYSDQPQLQMGIGINTGFMVVCTENLNAGVVVMKSAQDGA